MTKTRPIRLALALAVPLALAGQAQAASGKACPPTTAFNLDLDHLDGYRFFTGPNGDSEVAPLRIQGRDVPLLTTGKRLGMIDLPNAPKRAVQIVVGPPNVDLPLHPAPYKEMFILLGGSLTVKTSTFHADLEPGSVLLFEDVDAKIGHGGHIGPCGYISLSIAP